MREKPSLGDEPKMNMKNIKNKIFPKRRNTWGTWNKDVYNKVASIELLEFYESCLK